MQHVKDWQEELRVEIGDTGLEVEVYKMLQMVLEQTSTRLFQDCVSTLVAELSSDLQMKDFHDYFMPDGLWYKHQHV